MRVVKGENEQYHQDSHMSYMRLWQQSTATSVMFEKVKSDNNIEWISEGV